jgi:hypothetical protein
VLRVSFPQPPAVSAFIKAGGIAMTHEKYFGGKDHVPISIRFSFEEKARLVELAGSQPVSRFIRRKALEGIGETPRRKQRKKRQKPAKSEKQMAHLLGVFMDSRIAGNLNQLAKQANSGSLNTSDPEIKKRLFEAFDHIADMRNVLYKELGIEFSEE